MSFAGESLSLDDSTLTPWEETAPIDLPTTVEKPLATRGEPGRYAILRRLGSGGMGVVYKAYDHKMERLVAVKRLNPSREGEGGIARFFNEAKAIAQLNHPNIVSIYDIVEDRRGFFIVMELVRGISLRMWVKRHGPVPRSVGLDILRQVAEALAYAHRRDIIHRDVKPGNILIGRDCLPKIVDFGVAMIGGKPPVDVRRRVAGTRGYMAPEARWNRSRVDTRADVYSFGMTALQAFAGTKPWLVHKYPPFIADVILRATRENPKDRYAHMRELLDDWTRLEEETDRKNETIPDAVRKALSPPPSRRDVVEIRGGGRDGEIVPLSEPVTLLGRSAQRCDILLGDPEVSRVHLKIIRDEGEVYAFDMGSQNGIQVGNQTVRSIRLTEGMEIRIGDTILRYL